ncbi:Trafficking protein particle complex subunit, partial [Thalictrum thalictroides]
AIKVDLEFKNPLKISISVSGVSLICQLSEKTDSVESEVSDQHATDKDGHLSTSGLQNDLELKKLKSSWETNSCNSSICQSEVDFSLGGCETTKVHLAVTPQLEGVLNIIGVRWKLSGSTVGYHNFDAILEKKRVKGKRRTRKSPSSNLKFTVIKSLPKLEGSIIHMPERAYAGELRRVVLELRNQSKYPVKNLKMKISHPRFLYPGRLEDIKAEFPSCLEKQIDCKLKDMHASSIQSSSNLLFSFPEDVTVHGESTFSWPLWLRAASPGSIPLYISIYYEMENVSNDMRYRTLRVHYNIEVLPSLDVSFQISPSPSRLSEFLVRMDIVNKTSSESFQLKQFSSVGCEWEISSLPPNGTACPSQLLIAGQALSSFFKLKKSNKSTCEPTTSSLSSHVGRSDVSLGPQAGVLFDISSTPLADFHHYERLHQVKSNEGGPSNVDFILIAQTQDSIEGSSGTVRLFCHHACHCSIASESPVSWRMDGPQALHHDFSSSFCEIGLCMTIHNSSDYIASVRIHTPGPQSSIGQLSDAAGIAQTPKSAGNQEGWYDASLVNDIKVTSDVMGTLSGKPSSLDSTAPYIWSASSSTKVEVGPMSSTKIPLQVSLFSPGTYNLSNYNLHWSLLLPSNKDGLVRDQVRQTSGTIQGHSYHLTVLQSP